MVGPLTAHPLIHSAVLVTYQCSVCCHHFNRIHELKAVGKLTMMATSTKYYAFASPPHAAPMTTLRADTPPVATT